MTFDQYLEWLGLTPAEYAKRIGNRCSRQAIQRYRDGRRIPRPAIMDVILKEARGKLTADSFLANYSGWRPQPSRRAA